MDFVSREELRKAFQNKFYPRSFCDAKRNEFMSLVQSNITMTKYEKKFTELAKYTLALVIDVTDKCMRIERCLAKEKNRKAKEGLCSQSTSGLERVMVGISRGIIRAKGEEMLQYGQRKPFKRDRCPKTQGAASESVNQPYHPSGVEDGPSGIKGSMRPKS
ncbi:uncharacterized protein E5676_scaffold7319G00040 [Cucumis melo var. makuwa]|uniref:Retrotransposon gag domain-containing protein n=1 Tax=Cucumis melo var. makuwa TaxID=1194695 RepID=A0A5D3DUB0_CUCMM|nr:uncharacterized protein E5676_scaffold7319G00040 [Cucumis melo var. makuwa]